MPYLSLTLKDSHERTTRRLYELVPQDTLVDYQAAIITFLDRYEEVTDLGVIRVDLILDAFRTGFATTAGANVDVGATFQGYTDEGNGEKASMKLPGIKTTFVDAVGNVPIAGAIEDWLESFETGEIALLSDGEAIVSWIGGHLDK